MHDPRHQRREPVHPGCDATHKETVIAVFCNASFAGTMTSIIETVLVDARIDMIVVGCTTSFHRADTSGRQLASMLNSLGDGRDHRLYNAKFFPMCDHTNLAAVRLQFADAVLWTTEPWVIAQRMDGTTHFQEWVASRPASQQSWNDISEWIDRYNDTIIEVAGDQGGPDRKKARVFRPFGSQQPSADPPPSGSSSSRRLQPHPPTEPPPIIVRPAELERWERNDGSFDPFFWKDVLTEYRIDRSARQELFLLSQISRHGRLEAGLVISKLIKKASIGEVLDNPSAFVTTACRNAFKFATPRRKHK
jgi:hypothetical protein